MLVSQFPKMIVDAAYGADIRVKLDGVTAGTVTVATATDVELGTTETVTLAAGDRVSVMPIGIPGVRYYIASKAIATDTAVYAAAAGKISDAGTLFLGYSMEAASGDGSRIKVFGNAPYASASLVTLTGEETLTNKTLTAPVIQIIAMSGTTGNQEIRLTDNLADALSIEGTHGDFITFTTTDGAEAINMAEATIFTDNVTISGAVDLIFSGTTGQCEIVVPDNVADALSIKDGTGGADIIVITTTNSAETVAFNVPVRLKVVTTAVAAAGSDHTDGGQLARANIVHISSDGAAKGVLLPTGVMGDWMFVINDSATAAELYAALGGTVNGLAANASVVVPASKGLWLQCTAADTWIAFDLPALATAS